MPAIGLIRVLSSTDPELVNRHGRLLESFIGDRDLQVISRCIEGHPQGLWNQDEIRKAIPKIVRLGQEMERHDGVAALLVSCAADPGVLELRDAVSVPVIGAGSASAAVALSLGRPVGALGITDWVLPAVSAMLGSRLVGWEVPEGVKTTLDLMSPQGQERFVAAGERLKRRDAGVILLACTGFSTVGVAPLLEKYLGLPVIDPLLAAGLIVYYAARGNT